MKTIIIIIDLGLAALLKMVKKWIDFGPRSVDKA